MQHPTKKAMTIKLTIVLLLIMAVINTIKGPEIGTDHTPLISTLSTNPIKIKTATRDNYKLTDWQLFQIQTSKWEKSGTQWKENTGN